MPNIDNSGNRVRKSLLYSALVAALSISAYAIGEVPIGEVEQGNQNGIAFENGGWSIESSDAIKAHAARFPVMLTFAWNQGNYLADVNIQVTNRKGDAVLRLQQQGPIVLIDLPNGSYTVNVDRNGKSQSRNISIGRGGRTNVVFRWARDEPEQGPVIADSRSRG
jgi:hypothetical protein